MAVLIGNIKGAAGPPGAFANSFRGEWSAATPYVEGDIVTHQGSSWLASAGSSNATPGLVSGPRESHEESFGLANGTAYTPPPTRWRTGQYTSGTPAPTFEHRSGGIAMLGYAPTLWLRPDYVDDYAASARMVTSNAWGGFLPRYQDVSNYAIFHLPNASGSGTGKFRNRVNDINTEVTHSATWVVGDTFEYAVAGDQFTVTIRTPAGTVRWTDAFAIDVSLVTAPEVAWVVNSTNNTSLVWDDLTYTSATQQATPWEAIALVGATGPAGATGYTHIQSEPSASWYVVHNLGRRVAPTLYLDSESGPVVTDYSYVDENSLSITWPSPATGQAIF